MAGCVHRVTSTGGVLAQARFRPQAPCLIQARTNVTVFAAWHNCLRSRDASNYPALPIYSCSQQDSRDSAASRPRALGQLVQETRSKAVSWPRSRGKWQTEVDFSFPLLTVTKSMAKVTHPRDCTLWFCLLKNTCLKEESTDKRKTKKRTNPEGKQQEPALAEAKEGRQRNSFPTGSITHRAAQLLYK